MCPTIKADHPHVPTCVIDDAGNQLEFTYDDAGNALTQTDVTTVTRVRRDLLHLPVRLPRAAHMLR